MQPLVSIITPCYNSEDFINEMLDSVLNQTYTNWEHILVNDASTDNTPSIIDKRAKCDDRITIIHLSENSGSAVARNQGIDIAKGKYLAFLDSDDRWLPAFIQKSIDAINSSGIPFVYSSFKRCNEVGDIFYSDVIVPEKVSYTDILKTNSIGCLTAFIDVSRLGKLDMPLIRKRQDMGLWLKYLKKTPYAKGILEPLAIYRIRKGSLSDKNLSLVKAQWHFYRAVEKLSILKSAYYMVFWMVLGYNKYRL